jgi:inner membrane transporter RhtA
MASALVVALASSVLPYSLELEALRRLPEAVFGVRLSLAPPAGFVVRDQDLGAHEWLAIAMVIVASAWAASRSRP